MLGGMMARTLHSWEGLGVEERETPGPKRVIIDRKLKPNLRLEGGIWIYREYFGTIDTFIIRAKASSIRMLEERLKKN